MTALDRQQQPPRGAIRSFDFPDVERRRLSSGLDLRVAIVRRLPVVSVRLFLRGGESALRSHRAGLAVLTAAALDGGTDARSGAELAEALEGLGARLGSNAGWEGTSISLYCLADRLPDALEILAESVRRPAFPADEVERARSQHLAGIKQREMDPSSLASDAAMARYFASEVPYARPIDGTLESLGGVSRTDLVGYAEANLRPGEGGLVMVGDVDPDEMASLAEAHLGTWSGAPGSGDDFTVSPATRERTVLIVDRPGSVQSEIRVGHVGVARSDPDYFPLSIANMVLGGTFTSRLNLNLRERNGFTYGVRSRFGFRKRPGPFSVSTAVGNDVTAAAVREIVAEIEALAQGGPTEAEVTAARDYAAGIFGLQLETAGQIATRVSQLVVYGLADDYYHRYRDEMRAVTRDDAAAAVGRHVRPDELQVVVVGDAAAVRGPLEELGLGVVEVRSVQPGQASAAS